MKNKYGAIRCWSALCGRNFDSKAERARGEDLYMQERAGLISQLRFQEPVWKLSAKPLITYKPDFWYLKDGKEVFEDSKGILTRETRVKLAWLKEKYGIEVQIVH